MLAVISTLAPYKPNADSLASEIGISRNSVQDYLSLLERAQLIGQLRDDVKTTNQFDDMLGINEHRVIVTGEFTAAVRKAAKASVIANSKQVSSQKDSKEKNYHFDWK